MNISYNWLRDLIDLDLSPDDTAAALTRVGLAVEGVHPQRDDFVLDIDLTSNRPDCLSHLGVARELSVSLDRELKLHPIEAEMPMPPVLAGEIVRVDASDLCHRFTARIIRGVKVGASPQWLVERLEAIGERSINNIADITNYVMHELGQPMHSFDLDKLSGKRIIVRRAAQGEKITTLDEVKRELDTSMLAICDAEKPVAVAGVMGGIDSGITDGTTNVLLEVAYFDRASVRAASRKLNLTTEASYRFERGVDIENLKRASDRAVQLICELAAGEKGEFIDNYPTPIERLPVRSANISAAVGRLTGLDVEAAECDRILSRLGIQQLNVGEYLTPSWRHDIAIEEDMVEEVARHAGYEKIALELPPAFGAGEYQPSEERKRRIRSILSDLGSDEAISYSFIDTRFDQLIDPLVSVLEASPTGDKVTLQDSVIDGAVRMRPSMLPGLLTALRLNLNQQRRNIKLFEIGRVFASGGDGELPVERELLSLVMTGGELFADKATPARNLDFYDLKGSIDAALGAAGIPVTEYRGLEFRHYQRGQSAGIFAGNRSIGTIGRINDLLAGEFKFRSPVFAAEIDLTALFEIPVEESAYLPLSRFPAVSRDVSFRVGRDITYADIRNASIAAGVDFLHKASFVDIFDAPNSQDGSRSLTLRFEYRCSDRTLTEDEVEVVHQQLLTIIQERCGISTG